MKTFNKAVEKYHKIKGENKNDKTYLKYFNGCFGDVPLNEISKGKEQIIEAKLGIEGTAGTVNRYLNFLRAVLNFAYDELGWLDRRPKISRVKEPAREIKYLTVEEAAKLHEELPDHLKAPFLFSLLTGVRMSNCFGLKWEHIKDNKAWINADKSKSGKSIAIPLNTACLDLLNSLDRSSEYLFTYAGRRLTRASNTGWYNALKRAGLAGFKWHEATRHTWASHHSMNGTSIHALKTLGGWSNIDVVVNNYAHLSDDYLSKACENVNPLVSLELDNSRRGKI